MVFAWIAYLALVFMVVTHKIRIADFLTSIIILAVAFFVLMFLTLLRAVKGKRLARSSASQTSMSPAQPAADESGSITFRVAGVTFENDDGESRQDILRHLKFGDAPWADGPDDLTGTLEETDFEGEPAIAVLVNTYQVGFVPKSLVGKVSAALKRSSSSYVSEVRIIGGGTSADGKSISYGCEIVLEY